MRADVELYSIQLPGRDGRLGEAPQSNLVTLIEALAEGLAPRLVAPYALFGHSLGALIAYELVRQQRRRGAHLPVRLFVSARRAPQVPNPEPSCHQLPEDAFVEALVQRYNGIPQAVLAEPELMRLFLPILRADFALMETYQHVPEDPLDQAITVFGGAGDQTVSRADLEPWKETTRGECDIHMMPGGHFFLQTAQAALLAVIARKLAEDGFVG
jgi:medium-chain acyl-[acyl-carrier-protein] hydrolase